VVQLVSSPAPAQELRSRSGRNARGMALLRRLPPCFLAAGLLVVTSLGLPTRVTTKASCWSQVSQTALATPCGPSGKIASSRDWAACAIIRFLKSPSLSALRLTSTSQRPVPGHRIHVHSCGRYAAKIPGWTRGCGYGTVSTRLRIGCRNKPCRAVCQCRLIGSISCLRRVRLRWWAQARVSARSAAW
jgi:hypothetical protein